MLRFVDSVGVLFRSFTGHIKEQIWRRGQKTRHHPLTGVLGVHVRTKQYQSTTSFLKNEL